MNEHGAVAQRTTADGHLQIANHSEHSAPHHPVAAFAQVGVAKTPNQRSPESRMHHTVEVGEGFSLECTHFEIEVHRHIINAVKYNVILVISLRCLVVNRWNTVGRNRHLNEVEQLLQNSQ